MNEKELLHEIESVIARHHNPVVAFSFGKDSQIAYHLVQRAVGRIPIVFNNTLVENPDTLKFKKFLTAEWDLKVIEAKPLHGWNFWKIVEKFGFPVGQRIGAEATGKCCYHLKKAPMKNAMKEHGWDLVIDGMTTSESRQRFLNIKEPYRFVQGWHCHKYSPIHNWTPSDVWDYIEKYNLPYNPYYDNELPDDPNYTKRGYRFKGYWRCLRLGCWPCTVGLKYRTSWTKHLRLFYPRLYKILLKKGLAKFLIEHGKNCELYQTLDPDWIAEYRPCYFDGVTV